MQRLEVSGAVRPIYGSLGVKRLNYALSWKDNISRFLTLNPLTWKIWWAPNNASKWQVGFNSAFKGLNKLLYEVPGLAPTIRIKMFAFRLNILLQLD